MAAEWVYERACVFFGGKNVICVPWCGWELNADFIIFHSVPGVWSASCESTFVRDARLFTAENRIYVAFSERRLHVNEKRAK